jgi:SpoVK/Ycf46/Vps4 family AAA+-type ATPase
MMAHAIASKLEKKILNVDIPTFIESKNTDRFLPGLFRQARLHDAILFFDECEVIFGSRSQGNIIMTQLLTEIEAFEGIAILATNLPQTLDDALDRRLMIKQHFPEPDRHARESIWRRHLPDAANVARDVNISALADRFDMSGGYIKNAVLMGLAAAVHECNGEDVCIKMKNLEQAAKDQLTRPVQNETGLTSPKARLKDVVLNPKNASMIEEMLDAARNLKVVLQQWRIGEHFTAGKGISALFYGPPGTGKTLCAEAIAGELHRPLLTAHIPSLVSKWVGETETNLDRLFKKAKSQNAVLFFDEADSLLMKRGDGHASRHDDSIVNVLLKLIEQQEGLVIMATNMQGCLDPAVERRLSYRLHFSLPSPEQRSDIWKRLLPDSIALSDGIDFDILGREFALGGGNIKNAVFKAAFRAARSQRKITQKDLIHAIREEAGGFQKKRVPIGFSAMPLS